MAVSVKKRIAFVFTPCLHFLFKATEDANVWSHCVSKPEIRLQFSGQRRSSAHPDQALQEALRTRLRVVESNSQDVIQLFKVIGDDDDGDDVDEDNEDDVDDGEDDVDDADDDDGDGDDEIGDGDSDIDDNNNNIYSERQ